MNRVCDIFQNATKIPGIGMRTEPQLVDELMAFLAEVRLLPIRCQLELNTPGVTLPMLRGVWGAALHDLDPEAYQVVFEPKSRGNQEAVPLYLLRLAPKDESSGPGFEWTLLGEALRFEESCRRAWDIASGRGIGPNRDPFVVRRMLGIAPGGRLVERPYSWTLADAAKEAPEWLRNGSPLIVHFRVPVRLMRQGQLIRNPVLMDLVVAATRRIGLLLPSAQQTAFRDLAYRARDKARAIAQGDFYGQRRDVRRYSGRQKREVELYGMVGRLELPEGAGPLWPLLCAAAWIHIGKGTVHGLGQVVIEQPDE
ncbi:MAG: hypothetical protein KatS3mg110_2010 [Pirellulaceae bacterium]|nr:MAG: hypothetical protein KatS3mg110_2010 [Pirellulaceae bacterium]